MDVKTALLNRKSTRAFLNRDVSIAKINEIIERNNSEIAFPTRTLHINNEVALNDLR